MHLRKFVGLGLATALVGSFALSPAEAREADKAETPPTGPARSHGYDTAMLEALATSRGTTIQAAAARLDAQAGAIRALESLKATSPDVDGAYFVRTDNKMRVNVKTSASAERARAAGLVPRTATRGETDLNALARQIAQLAANAKVLDLKSAALDIPNEAVVITLGESVKAKQFGRDIAKLTGVKVQHKPGVSGAMKPKTTHIGGNGMEISPNGQSRGGICTQGFSGLRQGRLVMLTVGHCYTGVGKWVYTGVPSTATYLGQVIGNAFTYGRPASAPAPDVALVQLTPSAGAYSSINTHVPEGYRPMAEAQDPYYAMDICKSGTRSGWSCGWVGLPEPYVLWYDDDDNPIGHVGPTWLADYCSVEGDSGGPIVSGNFAIGLVSGGADNPCPLNAAWTHRVTDQSHFTTVSHVLRSYPGTTTNF